MTPEIEQKIRSFMLSSGKSREEAISDLISQKEIPPIPPAYWGGNHFNTDAFRDQNVRDRQASTSIVSQIKDRLKQTEERKALQDAASAQQSVFSSPDERAARARSLQEQGATRAQVQPQIGNLSPSKFPSLRQSMEEQAARARRVAEARRGFGDTRGRGPTIARPQVRGRGPTIARPQVQPQIGNFSRMNRI